MPYTLNAKVTDNCETWVTQYIVTTIKLASYINVLLMQYVL